MRLKRGRIVEVYSKEGVPTGAWRPAEIVSGNGRTFFVKYCCPTMTGDAEVGRVPMTLIRPCPPPMVIPAMDWASGDLVEVLHDFSWKMARVVKVMGRGEYLVRVFWSAQELRVRKSQLRTRLCWQDGRWVLVGKGVQKRDVTKMGDGQPNKRIKLHVGGGCCLVEEHTNFQEYQSVSSRILKRASPLALCDLEADTVVVRRKRAVETDGSHQQISSVLPGEKVDAVVFPNDMCGKNYVNSSFNPRSPELSRTNASKEEFCPRMECSISSDTDSCASSVGSCSAIGCNADNLPVRHPSNRYKNREDYCSDAESTCGPLNETEECSFPSKEELGMGFHRPELKTYVSIIRALYASGPLSWEDEHVEFKLPTRRSHGQCWCSTCLASKTSRAIRLFDRLLCLGRVAQIRHGIDACSSTTVFLIWFLGFKHLVLATCQGPLPTRSDEFCGGSNQYSPIMIGGMSLMFNAWRGRSCRDLCQTTNLSVEDAESVACVERGLTLHF